MSVSKQVTNSAKRRPPAAGKGRPKGALNKTTKLLKDATIMAAELVGSDGRGKGGLVGFLRVQARKPNNAPFMSLLAKVLPIQLAGGDGGAIHVVFSGDDENLL